LQRSRAEQTPPARIAAPHRGVLTLDELAREQLALASGEEVRVLRATPRTLTLLRTGNEALAPVPWDRELVLTTDIQSFPLADVLNLVHNAGKSGFLVFLCPPVEKCVYLRRGEVVFACSNQPADRLGECLMRAGRIELEKLREIEQCYSPTQRFGKTLVERGILTPRELWQGVRHQVEDIVRSLFAYAAGVVHFWEGEVEPDNVVRLSLPTRRLIAEGLEGRDEVLRFVAHLEDPRVSIRRIEGSRDLLSGNGRAVYDALEGDDHFATLCPRAGLDPLATARTLQFLKLAGAVEIEVGEDDDAALVDPERASGEDAALHERVIDHVRLLTELVAPLVAIDGEAAVRDRLGAVLHEVAATWPALLGGIELGPGCAIDPEALARRALRLAGQRETCVSAALGELIAYAEFELKNHPGIEDGEHFLDALGALRTRIHC